MASDLTDGLRVRQPTKQELEDLQKAEAAVTQVLEQTEKDWRVMTKDPDKVLQAGKNMSDWLQRELDNLLVFPSPDTLAVIELVRDHVAGDVTLKAFQLSTLAALTRTYEQNVKFQWFINSSAKTLAMVAINNPRALFYDFFNPGVTGPIEHPGHAETLTRLSTMEKAVLSSIEPSAAGFYYLYRRPWLCNYITALLFYRHFNSMKWFGNAIQMLREALPPPKAGQQAVNPDDIPIDIPYPVITPKLNDLPI